VYLLLQTL
ncbi:S1 RNA binding domain protein, partial [Chlamydia psittaci 84-8471/1]